MNLTDTYDVRHNGVTFLTGQWTHLNADGLGGTFRGITPSGELELTGLAIDNRGLRTFVKIDSNEGCVQGHSGSRVSECDRDGTTTRGGFWYCAIHASWYDWADADQDDSEQEAAKRP
jgi:hypothetical protein